MPAPHFRAGDRVEHVPTGETWLLLFAGDGRVMPGGWPPTLANPADCKLVEAATDEQHRKMLQYVASKQTPFGWIREAAVRQLSLLDQSFVGAYI